jgi:hypothetical protein
MDSATGQGTDEHNRPQSQAPDLRGPLAWGELA